MLALLFYDLRQGSQEAAGGIRSWARSYSITTSPPATTPGVGATTGATKVCPPGYEPESFSLATTTPGPGPTSGCPADIVDGDYDIRFECYKVYGSAEDALVGAMESTAPTPGYWAYSRYVDLQQL